jgi:predicted nucleic acid-binding protein
MKRLFLDTNILIDLLADRKPYSKFSKELLTLAEQKEVRLFTSSHAMATTYYVLNKYGDDKALREAMAHLADLVNIMPIDADMVKKGLKSQHRDFEDALQIFCSYSIDNLFAIVTRNIKDFKSSAIKAYTPDTILLML